MIDYHDHDWPAQVRAVTANRGVQIPIAASYRLADAAQALAQVTGGHAAGRIRDVPSALAGNGVRAFLCRPDRAYSVGTLPAFRLPDGVDLRTR